MPAQLFAMGLIDEASHVLMARYREQFDPEVMTAALDWFAGRVGSPELDTMLLTFVEHFPGQSVMRGEETPRQWLNGKTGNMPAPRRRARRTAAAVVGQSQRGVQAVRRAV